MKRDDKPVGDFYETLDSEQTVFDKYLTGSLLFTRQYTIKSLRMKASDLPLLAAYDLFEILTDLPENSPKVFTTSLASDLGEITERLKSIIWEMERQNYMDNENWFYKDESNS